MHVRVHLHLSLHKMQRFRQFSVWQLFTNNINIYTCIIEYTYIHMHVYSVSYKHASQSIARCIDAFGSSSETWQRWHIEIIQLLNSDVGMPAKHSAYVHIGISMCIRNCRHIHMYKQLVLFTKSQCFPRCCLPSRMKATRA